MSGHRNHGNFVESLEARQMMAVTLSNFTINDPVVITGQNVTLSVDAVATSPDTSITAATWFNDVNNNGIWDSGTDVDLGASFAPFSGNTFRRTIAVPGSWSGTIHIVADAVSNAGHWSSNRQQNSVRVNPRPTVTNFTISSNSFDLVTPLTLTTTGADDGSIRAVTWFLDRDLNGLWSPGVDTSLATSFTPDSGTTYSAQVTADSTWPRVAQILTDVQDTDLDWSSGAGDQTTTQTGFTRPTVTNLVATFRFASIGPGAVRLAVDASDNSAVYLATFFADLDGNAAWTPAFDQDFGVTRLSSNSATYVRDILTDLSGKASVQFAADAQDFDGLYASSRATVTLNNDIAVVTDYAATFNSNGGGGSRIFDTSFGVSASSAFGRTGTLNVNINTFIDVNGNGLYNAGTDLLLGSTPATITRGTVSTFTPQVTVPSSVVGNPRLGIFVTDNAGTSEISTVHIAAIRADFLNVPTITTQVVSVGDVANYAIPSSGWDVSGTFTAPLGAATVTLFWDKNANGRWDTGSDIDLGFTAVTGTSGSYHLFGTITNSMVGWGQFVTAVRDTSGRTNDDWSAPYTSQSVQIFRAPTVSNGAAASGTAGSTISIDFDATDDFGIRAVSGFIDINGNGLLDGGDAATSGTAFSPLTGTRSNGRWRLQVNTTGLSAGVYTVYVAANDFYKGDASASGGVSTGFWSSRLAITLTLT